MQFKFSKLLSFSPAKLIKSSKGKKSFFYQDEMVSKLNKGCLQTFSNAVN